MDYLLSAYRFERCIGENPTPTQLLAIGLEVERSILEDLRVSLEDAKYLHLNQRVLNRVFSTDLGQEYYILQIADYDVDSITPFDLKQNQPSSSRPS